MNEQHRDSALAMANPNTFMCNTIYIGAGAPNFLGRHGLDAGLSKPTRVFSK
jgi:hypothetical protein